MTREELKEKIKHISELEDNWDYEGAKAIPKKVIETAMGFADILTPVPNIFPTRRETVQFEWEKEGYYLEMEISEDKLSVFNMYTNEEGKKEVVIVDDEE